MFAEDTANKLGWNHVDANSKIFSDISDCDLHFHVYKVYIWCENKRNNFAFYFPSQLSCTLSVLGRGWCNRRLENLGIAKIGLTPPPLTPILALWWISRQKRVNATRDILTQKVRKWQFLGECSCIVENLGIAKIGLTPPPYPNPVTLVDLTTKARKCDSRHFDVKSA